MNEDFGKDFSRDFFTLIGEDGEEIEVEVVDVQEIEGEVYYALTDVDEDPESEEMNLYILKEEKSPEGEDTELVAIEDEDELEMIYNIFMDSFEKDTEE